MCFSHNEPNTAVCRSVCCTYMYSLHSRAPAWAPQRVCRSVHRNRVLTTHARTCHSRPHQDEGAAAAAQQPSPSSHAKHTLDDDSENDPLDGSGVTWTCRKCNQKNGFEELYCTKTSCKRGKTRELRGLQKAPGAITSAERGGYAMTQPNILLYVFFYFESSGVMLPLCSMKRHRHHVRMSETNALATTVKALLVTHASCVMTASNLLYFPYVQLLYFRRGPTVSFGASAMHQCSRSTSSHYTVVNQQTKR
jgi:hypothetical protein